MVWHIFNGRYLSYLFSYLESDNSSLEHHILIDRNHLDVRKLDER